MLTGQAQLGGAMPRHQAVRPPPGQGADARSAEEYRSDDCLWFFNAVPAYVAETGEIEFYNKVLPYADKGEATVLGHLRRALEFNLERTGRNGLPCGLAADWNDCCKLGYTGRERDGRLPGALRPGHLRRHRRAARACPTRPAGRWRSSRSWMRTSRRSAGTGPVVHLGHRRGWHDLRHQARATKARSTSTRRSGPSSAARPRREQAQARHARR